MPRWTEQQQAVIDTRGMSQMVSAAAGSGKTAVMTEHVIRLVEEGVDIASMAIVTFTQAAAGEMRQRISDRLEAAMERKPRLRGQLERLDDAWISTFHALCTRIITRYGAVAQLPPGLTAASEEEQTLLWQDAIDDAMEAAFALKDPGLMLLARGWGGRDGRGVAAPVRQLYEYVMARPQGLSLLPQMAEAYARQAEHPEDSLWQQAVNEERARLLSACQSLLTQALALCHEPGGPAGYEKSLQDDLAALNEGRRFQTLRGKRKSDNPELTRQAKALRDRAKALYEKRLLPLDDLNAADMDVMIPAVQALAELTQDTARRYALLKEERGVMDFSDMEHFALRALEQENVADELRDSFSMVLVDEYQDTNRVQEAILNRISRPDNLFTVGDVKQAIYGFRQAEPGLFLARCALPEDASRRMTRLSHNFRSAPGVVDFVNTVFGCLMTRERGGVDYTEAERLHCRAPRPDEEEPGPQVEFLLVGPAEEEDEEEPLAEMSRIEQQAMAAAEVIQKRMGRPIYDGKLGGFRTCRWSDFAILMRSRQGKTAPVAQVLEQQGIAAYALGGGGWSQQLEVEQTIDLLRLLDNRHRDLELMCVMRSAFGGFSLRELWAIRRAHPLGSYEAAAEDMACQEGELPRKTREFLSKLEAWREDARVLATPELIWKVLDESGYYDLLGALPGGDVRQGNLRLLMEKARALAGTRNQGLYGLLRHLERLAQGQGDTSLAITLPENADVVRVTTIHGSKGLEYPVVILMDLDKAMNNQGCNADRIQMDETMGFGLKALLVGQRRWHDTLSREAMAMASRRREISEEVRVLYVALTRARESLVLIGSAKGLDRKLKGWALPLEAALEAGEGCYLNWLGPILLRCSGAETLRERAGLSPEPEFACPVRVTMEQAPRPRRLAMPPLGSLGEPDPQRMADFAWHYPYRTGLPAKIAATDRVKPADRVMTRPGPAGRFTAAQRGTFTHQVLERLERDPVETARRLAEQGLIPKEALAEIHYDWLEAWLQHPLWARAQSSSYLARELPFNLQLSAMEALDEPDGDPVMVQGVIDLAFLEGDQWVLVDYKTGDVLPGMEQAYLSHYAPQIKLYRLALERLTDRPVREAGLYILPRAIYLPLGGEDAGV